jgi:hypothetical protein
MENSAHDDELRAAQRKMSELALSLQRRFPPLTVVSLFAGAMCGILENTLGLGGGARYMAELAAEMSGDGETKKPLMN